MNEHQEKHYKEFRDCGYEYDWTTDDGVVFLTQWGGTVESRYRIRTVGIPRALPPFHHMHTILPDTKLSNLAAERKDHE